MKNFRNLTFACFALISIGFTSCHDTGIAPQAANFDGFANATTGSGSGKSSSSSESVHVAINSLPAAITTYVSTKYPGKTITKAEKSVSKYEIVLSDATQLEFSLTGVFLEVSKGGSISTSPSNSPGPIKVSDDPKVALPQAIMNYIAQKYPTATIIKAEKGISKYEVTLSNRIKLEFSLNGTFKKAKSV
jgi:Putative beta-lactamase-inhibitor-like, PepSY-like